MVNGGLEPMTIKLVFVANHAAY